MPHPFRVPYHPSFPPDAPLPGWDQKEEAGQAFRVSLTCVATAAFLLITPAAARAGELVPGQTFNAANPEDPGRDSFDGGVSPVAGEVLAESVVPYEAIDGGEPGNELFSRGTVTTRVVREAGRPGLTFDYRIDETEFRGVIDMEQVAVAGFTGFATDVRAATLESDAVLGINRSADGRRVFLTYDMDGLDEYLVVRTNAPAFAPGGTFDVSYDFPGSSAPGNFGTVGVATFQPVPEPTGAAIVLASSAALLRRRRSKVH